MSDGIELTTDFSDAYDKIRWLKAYVQKQVHRLINTTSLQLQKHIRQDLFGPYPSGTTETTLSSRSGNLKKHVNAIPAFEEGDMVYGGINVGTRYAPVHFGKKGDKTVITGKPWLTIPLPAAMRANGTGRGDATDSAVFGKTFIRKSKAGNLIIFGKLAYTKGKRAEKRILGIRVREAETHGDLVPLFVLKESVTIPVRIALEDLREYIKPILGKGLADLKEGIIGSTIGSAI